MTDNNWIKSTKQYALTGIDSIDEQHGLIIDYIDKLREGIKSKNRKELIYKTLDALDHYCAHHFTFEEKIMEDAGYPGIEPHRKLHDFYQEKIISLRYTLLQGESLYITDLITFLKDWFVGHIQGEDQKYARFIQER